MASSRNSYHFDFIKAYGEDIGSADVVFPLDDVESIEINGKRQRGYCGHVGETGKSSDGLYYRVHLSDYTFWVDPADYHDLMDFLHERQKAAIEVIKQHQAERDAYHQRHAEQLLAGVTADPITDDIYWCYIQGRPDADLQKKFTKLTAAIAKKCEEHGGRLYKTAAKSAKYAIIADYRYYTDDNFSYPRENGYKVVTLEQAVEYMGLQKLWDGTVIESRLKEYAAVLAHPRRTHGTSITLTMPDISQAIEDRKQEKEKETAPQKKERVKYPPRRSAEYTLPADNPAAAEPLPPAEPVDTMMAAYNKNPKGYTRQMKIMKVLAPILCVLAAVLMLVSPIPFAVLYLIGVGLGTMPRTFNEKNAEQPVTPIYKRKAVIIAFAILVIWFILCISVQ
ncbi:MAG TPA: hypothetical protein H9745_06710 [Candidatus Agathobaculum stercoravium]|nr:hypothetical protein [Candidatus Agathobaculum stercoravium]